MVVHFFRFLISLIIVHVFKPAASSADGHWQVERKFDSNISKQGKLFPSKKFRTLTWRKLFFNLVLKGETPSHGRSINSFIARSSCIVRMRITTKLRMRITKWSIKCEYSVWVHALNSALYIPPTCVLTFRFSVFLMHYGWKQFPVRSHAIPNHGWFGVIDKGYMLPLAGRTVDALYPIQFIAPNLLWLPSALCTGVVGVFTHFTDGNVDMVWILFYSSQHYQHLEIKG